MSNDDREIPDDSALGWSRTPDAMNSAEFRERLVAEKTGSSKSDAWSRRIRRFFR